MGIFQDVERDMKEAMKARQAERLNTLRMVKSALKNEEIERGGTLDEEACVKVLVRLTKQRKESIEQFTRGGRADLAEQEARELALIETYLPAPPSAQEVEAAVQAAIAETGASTPKEMGKVMGLVTARFKGRPLDGKALSARVRAALGG